MDLEREADLIEEIARIYGLDKIPAPSPESIIIEGANDSKFDAETDLRDNLVSLGLTEIINYTMVSEKLLDTLDPDEKTRRVVLPLPISHDKTVIENFSNPGNR